MTRICTILLLLVLLSTNSVHARDIAYYDAMSLRSRVRYTGTLPATGKIPVSAYKMSVEDFKIAAHTLVNYADVPHEGIMPRYSDVLRAYQDNPFIAPMLPVLNKDDDEEMLPMVGAGYTPPLPPLNITNLADGMAGFLIKRGKEELSVAFFSRMKKTLQQHEECAVLFPATTTFLNGIETYRYAELLQSLRDAFDKDLRNIVVNLNGVINLPKYHTLLQELPEIRIALRTALIISELAQTGKTIYPHEVISSLAKLGTLYDADADMGNSYKALGIISEALRFENDTRQWITTHDMNKLMQDEVTLRLFLGLIYEQVKDIRFTCGKTSISFAEYLKINAGNTLALGALFENFVWIANETDALLEQIRTGGTKEEVFINYIDKVITIAEYGFNIAHTVLPCSKENYYMVLSKHAMGLYKNSYAKNYSSAIADAYSILDIVLNKSKEMAQEKLTMLRNTKQPVSDSLLMLSSKGLPRNSSKAVAAVLKYGNFMASAVKANTAAEVQNAIEAAALPVGSYSIKQKSVFNMSANAYVGYCWDFNNNGLLMRGVYAPIGISASTAISKRFGGAVGVFVSLVDIGGIVAYRLANGSTESLKQEIRLESILSPSAQLMVAIPKLPISVLAGWRMTPKLFYSSNISFTTILPQNVFNAGIVIDIPLFNIASKPLH